MAKGYGIEGVVDRSGSAGGKRWPDSCGKMQGHDETRPKPPEKTAGPEGARAESSTKGEGD